MVSAHGRSQERVHFFFAGEIKWNERFKTKFRASEMRWWYGRLDNKQVDRRVSRLTSVMGVMARTTSRKDPFAKECGGDLWTKY